MQLILMASINLFQLYDTGHKTSSTHIFQLDKNSRLYGHRLIETTSSEMLNTLKFENTTLAMLLLVEHVLATVWLLPLKELFARSVGTGRLKTMKFAMMAMAQLVYQIAQAAPTIPGT